MPPRTKHRQRRNSRRNQRAKRSKKLYPNNSHQKNWHFEENVAVCYSHSRSVCGICRMDFFAFNTIYASPTRSTAALCANTCKSYFKNPIPTNRKFKKGDVELPAHEYGSLLSLYLEQGIESMSVDDATSMLGFMSWTLRYTTFSEKNKQLFGKIMHVLSYTLSKHSDNNLTKQVQIAMQNQCIINQQKKVINTKFDGTLCTIDTLTMLLDISAHISKVGWIIEANDLYEVAVLWDYFIDYGTLSGKLCTTDQSTLCYFNFLASFAIKHSGSEMLVLMPEDVHSWSVEQMDEFLISSNISIWIAVDSAKFTHSLKIGLISAYIGLQNKFLSYKPILSEIALYMAQTIANGETLVEKIQFKSSQKACARVCSTCNKECQKRCSGCNNVYYCTRKCQKRDWKQHKKKCSAGTIDFKIFEEIYKNCIRNKYDKNEKANVMKLLSQQ